MHWLGDGILSYTHRRRRRDSSVELSRVGVARCVVNSQLSRRLAIWWRNWKLNIMSRVELCRAVCTYPSAVVTQFPVVQPTRLDKFSNKFSLQFFDQIHRELVANSIHTAHSTQQLSRVGVGSVYWALGYATVTSLDTGIWYVTVYFI